MNKLLYRPKEAAQLLGIGRDKLYDLMRSGRLTAALGQGRPGTVHHGQRADRVRRDAGSRGAQGGMSSQAGEPCQDYLNILSITSAPVVITGRNSCR